MPAADVARLDPLIGTWHTQGEVLDEDGSTAVATIEGTDSYEWLGRSYVIHRADVHMGGDHVEVLEVIGPYDPDTGTYQTRAYDSHGGIETSTAGVDDQGVWTFGTDGATATLRVAGDGQSMSADWVRAGDAGDGTTWRPWMRMRFTRLARTPY